MRYILTTFEGKEWCIFKYIKVYLLFNLGQKNLVLFDFLWFLRGENRKFISLFNVYAIHKMHRISDAICYTLFLYLCFFSLFLHYLFLLLLLHFHLPHFLDILLFLFPL